ncbi:MAG: RDD family protein [Desulfuromonas sp.]|nr:RDD family protein [Desulfuromonas sp.]
MDIQCPHCQFSRQVDASLLPNLPCKVTCPQCKQSFVLGADAQPELNSAAQSAPIAAVPTPDPAPAISSAAAVPPPVPAAANTDFGTEQPAGFWVRVLAAILDSMLCNLLVFVMGFVLGLLLNFTNSYMGPSAQLLLMVMGILVTLFYYVFFTGYCGQTPGKMALHIKVVHKDGSDVSYGQAFVRETIGKTVSSLIFCIGYLMVAFRSDKRGLHDLIAATKVNKL